MDEWTTYRLSGETLKDFASEKIPKIFVKTIEF